MGRFVEEVKDLLAATFLGEVKIHPERGEDDVERGSPPVGTLQGSPKKPSQAIPLYGRLVVFLAHREGEPGFSPLQPGCRGH